MQQNGQTPLIDTNKMLELIMATQGGGKPSVNSDSLAAAIQKLIQEEQNKPSIQLLGAQ